MNEFQLPFYLEVHQTRNFTIIQCNKVIHITVYYFKIWLYDRVNQYYSRGVHSSGMWWNITRWLVLYVLRSLCCHNIGHQSPTDTAPHPEKKGMKCTTVKLVHCYLYWMVVEQIISKCSALSNQWFILFCEKHIRCWKYLTQSLDVDMLYHFHIFYRCWSAYSLDLGIVTLNTGLYVGR